MGKTGNKNRKAQARLGPLPEVVRSFADFQRAVVREPDAAQRVYDRLVADRPLTLHPAQTGFPTEVIDGRLHLYVLVPAHPVRMLLHEIGHLVESPADLLGQANYGLWDPFAGVERRNPREPIQEDGLREARALAIQAHLMAWFGLPPWSVDRALTLQSQFTRLPLPMMAAEYQRALLLPEYQAEATLAEFDRRMALIASL